MYRLYLFVYDVVDDKRRTRVARQLETVGERVQYSVFEVYLTKKELALEKDTLSEIIDPKEDSIRIYFLCQGCKSKIITLGIGEVTSSPDVMIV